MCSVEAELRRGKSVFLVKKIVQYIFDLTPCERERLSSRGLSNNIFDKFCFYVSLYYDEMLWCQVTYCCPERIFCLVLLILSRSLFTMSL